MQICKMEIFSTFCSLPLSTHLSPTRQGAFLMHCLITWKSSLLTHQVTLTLNQDSFELRNIIPPLELCRVKWWHGNSAVTHMKAHGKDHCENNSSLLCHITAQSHLSALTGCSRLLWKGENEFPLLKQTGDCKREPRDSAQ